MPIFRRILVPVDGSEPANAAVALALKVADNDGNVADLVFCHVVDIAAEYRAISEAQMIVGAQDMIEEDKVRGAKLIDAVVKTATDAGVKATGEILEGDPAETIVRRARDGGFDLIVTGTHGRDGLERLFLGSTAEHVLRHASVPVLAVKARTT
ncbi:MAG: hypothetical protein NVSMB5_24760 [Candidatus Velthaea sp.]